MLITTDSFAEGGGLARSSLLDNQNIAQAIVRDPRIMHGTPVFRGTRVPDQALRRWRLPRRFPNSAGISVRLN
jgi:Protein of unknown function (DUF433)